MANEKDVLKDVKKNAEVKPEVAKEPKVEVKVEEKVDEDEEFINSLLEDVDTEKEVEDNEEQQRQKNKDAEEARKRRASEAKVKAEEEAAKKAELQAKVVATESAKPEEQVKTPNQPDVNKLGQQLVDFKAKYPDIDFAQLDNDKTFKKFIDGKLLGKKDFTNLYEEYVELKAEITGVEQKIIRSNYQKAQSSSGSSISPVANRGEVYSEEELRKVALRLPTMNPKEASKIEEKLKKSIAYYESKK